MTKRVKDYWPGDFERTMRQTLDWLYARGNFPTKWQGNALGTATTQKLWQCGIVCLDDLDTYAQADIENIVFDVPTGVNEDFAAGPDGFPINYSPRAVPNGMIFLNTFMLTDSITVEGRCFSLLDAVTEYRVDLFIRTDIWYYKGSATLEDVGYDTAIWSAEVSYTGNVGAMIAVLYPTTIAPPDPGWYDANLPAGWRAHTNMGVGKKLVAYNGRVYSKTDIEYLKESDLPIIVQDRHHARVGSTKIMGSGAPTMHIMFNDPEVDWIAIFSSLQHLAIFGDLPRSLDVPTSDPAYVPDITITNSAAVQNRCWIYDAALWILVCAYSGNHRLAQLAIQELNGFLDEPEYLAQTTLENCEDGSTARWTVAGDPGASITMWNDPLRAPFGGGKQAKMHAAAVGDNFTYIGPAVYGGGLPDSTDFIIQWQFRAHSSMTWYFEVALTTQSNNVTKLKVTSDAEEPPTYDSGTKTITWPIGPGNDDYHFYKFDLEALCADLASDTWTSTTGFKAVLTAFGDLHLDNLSCGTYQPDGALAFSYDVYNGLPDSYYIRAGAMAWVCYAYVMYMEITADYAPALYLQKMLNFLLTLENTANEDLRQGLFQGGYGSYQDPGYHYVPGLRPWCSTEHNVDLYSAFKRAKRILPTAAIALQKVGAITSSQAASLQLLANEVDGKADNIKTKLLANVYLEKPPNEIAGLQLWLKADAITGLSDGDPVGIWSDLSGQTNHALQGTESLKPLYKTNILNGKPVVRFDGIDDHLNANSLAFPSTCTVFAVVRNNSKASDAQIISRRSSTSTTPIAFQMYFAAINRPCIQVRDDAGTLATAIAASGSTGAQILTGIRNGNKIKVYQNGSLLGDDKQTLGAITTNQTRLGAKATATPAEYLDGDIAELIVYNSVLAVNNREQVEAYLGNKWGVAPLNVPGHFAQGSGPRVYKPATAPALSQVAGGSLPARTYYVKHTYLNTSGETTPSPQASLAVSANNLLKVTSPAASGDASGWNVYVSETSGSETQQNGAPVALGTDWTEPTGGLVSGDALPTFNSTGPDIAEALDAAGTWSALFCETVDEDAKALECLKFVYQKFYLTNQQILLSNNPATWNMAYEQLTPFSGFKHYAGGYSSPPASVTQEGTWGMISALLRCYELPGVASFFASVEGSLDSFLSKLIRDQATVFGTTGDGSLLIYSLASRSLPYEFSVWPGIGATAWFWLTAQNPGLLLPAPIETPWEFRPYLKVPQGVEQRIDQLEGRGSIGALELEAIDAGGYMTALVSGGKLEGRKATLKVGYPGLETSDFVTVVSQQIETVEALGDYTGFRLQCRDLKRSAKSKIFQKGDDGQPISKDHPRTLSANPMDVALIVFQNELGVGQVPGAPSSAWKLYDPSQWSGGSNPTLLDPNPYLDLAGFLFYRDGIFAGYVLDFNFEQPVEAKQFLDHEVFKALGGYLLVLSDGRLSPRFFVPAYSLPALYVFDDRNMTVLPRVERHPIINQVTYRMDYDGSKFQTELLFLYAPSLQQYALAGQHIVESKGVRLARGGASLAGITAERIFRRYSGIDVISGQVAGAALILNITAHYLTLPVEVGDHVYLNHPLLPNFATGQRGVSTRIFEVIEKQPNFSEATMQYKLLDTGWLASKKLSKVAPNGTPAWPSASQTEKDTYLFICDDDTGAYSDGTAGKTIF